MHYRAPRWLPGGHLQTIWPALYSRRVSGAPPQYRRERWTTPDQDFIDVDWLVRDTTRAQQAATPLLVLFHGLEGSSQSHYALAFADYARQRGIDYAVVHFRGCSGSINLAPRAYHSGDYVELDWMLKRMRRLHTGAIVAVGISLGGNALLRWAQECGHQAQRCVQALASVCTPLDLTSGGHGIGKGFNRLSYTPMFLRSMKPKALAKWQQFPGLFDAQALRAAQTLYAFDNIFTAPLHGYHNTDDYWQRASAKPRLAEICLPSLVLNARNDPFVPAASLPKQSEVGHYVTLWQPAHGGHVGFAQGTPPGDVLHMPYAVGDWLLQHIR